MKNCKSLVFGCIFALLALPLMGVASAQNLLPNGEFETGDLTDWQVFNDNPPIATVTAETPGNGPSFPGMNHAFLNNQQGGLGLTLKGETPAGSAGLGTVYYFLDLLIEEAAVGGLVWVQVYAEQAGGGILAQTGLLGPFTGPIGEWQIVQGTIEAPAGTDYLTIQIDAVTGADNGSVCLARVDNAFLGQTGPPVATEDMSMGSIKALFR